MVIGHSQGGLLTKMDDSLAGVASRDPGALLGAPRVTAAPMPDFGPAHHVMIHIE